jgi:hypothetical protein
MNSPRSTHGATLLPNGKVLVAGGLGVSSLAAQAELYDPATGTWTLTGPMTASRSLLTLTLLFNGKVLAAGQGSSELYDPATDTWMPAGSMIASRTFHSATLLNNGRVLVAGGRSATFSPLSTTEQYDPITGSWVASAPLHYPRYTHTATLLPNGLTFIAGGVGTNALDLATNELFDVNLGFSNSWRPQIDASSSPVILGGGLSVSGSNYRGLSEASGGNGTREAATDFPVMQLRSIESGQTLFLSCGGWSTQTFAGRSILSFPPGYALVTAFVNGIPSTGAVVRVSVPLPTPLVLTSPQVFSGGQFEFIFTNAPGALFAVLATTNGALPSSNWTTLGAAAEFAPGKFRFIDYQATNFAQRFYRVVSP